ncbi:MAG: hypothetical protein ACRCSY_06190 [Cetobacterium sp.]
MIRINENKRIKIKELTFPVMYSSSSDSFGHFYCLFAVFDPFLNEFDLFDNRIIFNSSLKECHNTIIKTIKESEGNFNYGDYDFKEYMINLLGMFSILEEAVYE